MHLTNPTDFINIVSELCLQFKSDYKFCNLLRDLGFSTSFDEHIHNELKSIKAQRNCTNLFNLLIYAHLVGDSTELVCSSLGEFLNLISSGLFEKYELLQTDELSVKDFLHDDYLDPSLIIYDASDESSLNILDSANRTKVLKSNIRVSEFDKIINQNEELTTESKKYSDSNDNDVLDADYWIRSVSFDTPFMPNCDVRNIIYQTERGGDKFVIYGEAVKPWNQSMIGLATDVNSFSDDEVLKLFPEIRLYTRGNELYHSVDGLDFDEDLGVIFHIKGFTKKQMIKNIIEYPHIFQFDRWVRKNGDITTIPFWKHIELNGEMKSSSSIWGTNELPDTKKIPKTPLFMNEYIMRKYILEENKCIEHKYKMRGELWPFLTLYAPPEYYERYGYDPLVVGRKCIQARQHLCMTRNPIINMHKDRLVDSKS